MDCAVMQEIIYLYHFTAGLQSTSFLTFFFKADRYEMYYYVVKTYILNVH